MITTLSIFGSTFLLVFALGFQSLNVNNGHYVAAFFTSIGIGISNLVLFKTVPQAGGVDIIAFLIGGPFGIVASMAAHARWMPHHPRRSSFAAELAYRSFSEHLAEQKTLGTPPTAARARGNKRAAPTVRPVAAPKKPIKRVGSRRRFINHIRAQSARADRRKRNE